VEYLNELSFNTASTPHEVLKNIKEELSSKVIFSEDFSEVTIVHQNELATLVPEALFDESNSADYLKYNSKILKSDYIAHDDIQSLATKNVYVPYVNINNYIFDTFGQFTYKHSLTVFIEAILQHPSYSEDIERIFINVNRRTFEIVVIKNGRLLLTNIHQYFSKEDFLYFVLFTIEQLDLDPDQHEIVLSGKISKDDDLYSLLYTYVRHLKFHDLPKSVRPKNAPVSSDSDHFIILNSL
jgi:hypothetical protein